MATAFNPANSVTTTTAATFIPEIWSDEIVERIREFKYEFMERPGWEKGSPKRVNNLTKYQAEETRLGKANMPGHVRAAINARSCSVTWP